MSDHRNRFVTPAPLLLSDSPSPPPSEPRSITPDDEEEEPRVRSLNIFLWNDKLETPGGIPRDEDGQVNGSFRHLVSQRYFQWKIFFSTLFHGKDSRWEDFTCYDEHEIIFHKDVDIPGVRYPIAVVFRSTGIYMFETQEDAREMENAAKKILKALEFREGLMNTKEISDCEMHWGYPEGRPVADVMLLTEEFWKRFETPTTPEVDYINLEGETVEEEESLVQKQNIFGRNEDNNYIQAVSVLGFACIIIEHTLQTEIMEDTSTSWSNSSEEEIEEFMPDIQDFMDLLITNKFNRRSGPFRHGSYILRMGTTRRESRTRQNPRHTPVINQPRQLNPAARLAQSVERETLKETLRNLKVVGSTPTSGSIPDVR
ncbi:hypothetical protein B0T20DRAFT_390441 [Sordaria brevicollis]|uniref:Uncharacterized protein n=1 Tax=Sordaria brevicollis TaxID=83679 RepID=A0AAE0PIG9_SORBR|nr:hypothetical protein B0T20DRAFT_390441 [Sordaria brevicollis]